MSYFVDPPFSLGQTLGLGEGGVEIGANWIGAIKQFPDVDPKTGTIRSNRVKLCVAVRNSSGTTLLPKRLVSFVSGSFSAVAGYNTSANNELVGVVDEHLAGGVADKDVFWVTVNGPTEVAVALSGTAVAVGDRLSAVSGATTGATTSGRVTPSTVGAATTSPGNTGIGVIAYAASAGATTGANVLAFVSTPVA